MSSTSRCSNSVTAASTATLGRASGSLARFSPDLAMLYALASSARRRLLAGSPSFWRRPRGASTAKNRQLINLNPDFPGLGNQNPFRCKFEVPDGATATLSRRQVNEVTEIGRHDKAVRHAVELIASQL